MLNDGLQVFYNHIKKNFKLIQKLKLLINDIYKIINY